MAVARALNARGRILASALFIVCAINADAPHAQAASDIEVTITSLAPAVPSSGTGITLQGRIGGTADLKPCRIVVRRGRSPLTSRSELRSITTSTEAAARRARTSDTVAQTQSAAQTGEWDVRITAARLGLTSSTAAGVYPLTISADCPDGAGYAASVIPWLPRKSAIKPSRVIMLWPIAQTPMRGLGNTWDDARLRSDLQPFGRLRSLLDSGRDAPVSWLIDPETVDLVALAAGRADARGVTRTGLDGQTRALADVWLNDLSGVAETQPILALPRALPAVSTVARGRAEGWAISAQDSAVTDLNRVLGSNSGITSLAAWPCGADDGCVTADELSHLLSQGERRPTVTVVPPDFAPVTRSIDWSPGGVVELPLKGRPRAVVTDAILDTTLRTSDGISEPTMLRQRILADFALVSLERPKSPRTLATTIAPGLPTTAAQTGAVAAASAFAAAVNAGVIESAQLADVADLPLDPTPRQFNFAIPQNSGASVLQQIRFAASDARAAAQLLTVASDREQWQREVYISNLNSTSLLWQDSPRAQERFIRGFRSAAAARRTGVHVVTANRVYLGRSSGTIPFTVINTLDRSVTVFPKIVGKPRARIDLSTPPRAVRLAPGERAGVPIGARILGSGQVAVSFSVLSRHGDVVSTPARTVVSTSAYARIAGYVVIAAFALLLLLVVNNIRRQVRRRRLGGDSDGHQTVEVDAT